MKRERLAVTDPKKLTSSSAEMRPASARTGAQREQEIAERFQRRHAERVAREFTADVAQALEHDPRGPHDDKTSRVLRALHSLPVAGKHIVRSLGVDGPWAIGTITVGEPGNLKLIEGTYDSYDDAYREVFRLRRLALVGSDS